MNIATCDFRTYKVAGRNDTNKIKKMLMIINVKVKSPVAVIYSSDDSEFVIRNRKGWFFREVKPSEVKIRLNEIIKYIRKAEMKHERKNI